MKSTENIGEKRVRLNRKEAADWLMCSIAKIDRLVRGGELTYIRDGGRVFFEIRDLDAYVDRCRIHSKSSAA